MTGDVKDKGLGTLMEQIISQPKINFRRRAENVSRLRGLICNLAVSIRKCINSQPKHYGHSVLWNVDWNVALWIWVEFSALFLSYMFQSKN